MRHLTPGRTTNEAQLLYINVQRFRGELVFKAHRLLYHSTLGLRVIKQSREESALSYSAAELESFCELDQFWSRCVSTRIETHLEQTLYNTRATHMAW